MTTHEVSARLTAALADRYRLERELGQGGMATVYLAEDLRHEREVAIKVLHPDLGATLGSDRFLSEIRTTARLQHPHILPLLDSGEAGGLLYYVMPRVMGETLRARLDRERQLPVDDAVRIAREVADALGYAHEHAVIHRDVKPENILLQSGHALVADFGIALAVQQAGGSRLTQTGLSLGTPQYMSPEQAMGERAIDARSDVYALGAVAYEMLAGDPPFTGSTVQAIVAKIMTERPTPLHALRDTVPSHVERAIHTALAKLPADRYASAAQFRDALAPAAYPPPEATVAMPAAVPPRAAGRSRRATAALAIMAVVTVASLAVAAWSLSRREAAPQAPPSRLAVLVPALGGASGALLRQIAITPDGSTLLYASIVEGNVITMRRRLDEEEAVAVPGVPPFVASYSVSPDGTEFIGTIAATQEAYRFPIEGGNGRTLPREVGIARNPVAWGSDGVVWFDGLGDVDRGLGRLALDNTVTRPFGGREANLEPMQVLPGDRTALVLSRPFGASTGPLLLLDLASGTTRPLVNQDVVQARYGAGYLVYALTNGTLEAIAFDAKRGEVTGRPVTVASGVSLTGTGVAQFDMSATGTVIYLPEAERSLMLVDRSGAARPAVPDRRNFHSPRFAPDGRRIAVDFTSGDGRDVWIADLGSGALARATFHRDGHDPTWAPGGSELTYISARNGVLGIWRTRPGSTAPAESLLTSNQVGYTGIWLKDGSGLVTTGPGFAPDGGSDIGIVRNGGRGPIEPLLASRFEESHPALSRDDHWLAYVSNQSGRNEVYVRALEQGGIAIQVSIDGGMEPVWGPDGRELFYRSGTGALPELALAVIEGTSAPAVVSRRSLFSIADITTATPHANFDISPDGSTFTMVRNNPSTRVMVIQNLPGLVARLRGE
ncbi:MAG TPA: protein kinase [Gemmatimonadales bacterium]